MAEIAVTIAIELARHLVSPIGRPISYVRNYKTNFENLKGQVIMLEDVRTNIQRSVHEAIRKGEVIEEVVKRWLSRANEIIDEEAETFLVYEEAAAKKQCFKGSCPDLKTRYHLSKKAVMQLQAVAELREEGRMLDAISYPIIINDPRLYNQDFIPFKSRISILNDILAAINDPNVSIIGIYGMSGVGKTELAKDVARQVERRRLSDLVVFAVLSKSPDTKKIQEEIADQLGLKFSEETVSGRAARLYARLQKGKQILVILDNIWAPLDLQEVGIFRGDYHGRCKVLLTGKTVDVLSDMNSQMNFCVGILDDEEAWFMFAKMAGYHIEGTEFKPIATKIVKECVGLPISIVAVANVLRNKGLFEWKEALRQLRRRSLDTDQDISIELSYNFLGSDQLKETFLLIGYTYMKSIDFLLIKLKDSHLLLDNNTDDGDFSMNDVIRKVSMSITHRKYQVFAASNVANDQWEWPDENLLKSHSSIVLDNVKIGELPEVLECPQLHLFSVRPQDLSLQIPDNFFRSMAKLRVLRLTDMHLSSLPSSLRFLTNLRTLCLYFCKLDKIAVIGALKKLEILCLRGSDIKHLPEEVGLLTQLKLLDLRNCMELAIIPPNLISHLSHLEELYLGIFAEWEMEGLNNERRNASLDELKNLSNLTSLEICIKDANTLPRDLLFRNLERYKIMIGNWWEWKVTSAEISRKFQLKFSNADICFNDGHIMQLKGIEDLCLEGLQDMKTILFGLDREGFPQLKYLRIETNPNLLCIVDSVDSVTRKAFPLLESLFLKDLINLEKICHGQLTAESFCNLRKINVDKCDILRNILSFSVAKGLQQLQTIQVTSCKTMEEIFSVEREDETNKSSEVIDIIELSQLRSLTINSLPQLRTFYCSILKTPSLSQQRQDESMADMRRNEIILEDNIDVPGILFNEKLVLPNLENLELCEINVERIWQDHDAALSSGYQNLTRLIIRGCGNLRFLCSSSIASGFVQLQHLEICECPLLEEIVVVNERKDLVFPQVEFLKMENLESLRKFFLGDYIEFSSLKELKIIGCPELKEFMVKNISTDLIETPSPFFNKKTVFPSLEQIEISHMDNLEMIWHNQLTEVSFCKLKSMKIEYCDKLRTLFPQNFRKFLRLESLSVNYCGSLEVIFDLEGPKFEKTPRAVSQLSELDICGLPGLKHIWNKDPKQIFSFQKLNMVSIVKCNRLKHVFPASIACSISQLESLNVSSCGVMAIVFVAEEGYKPNHRLVFPRVASLALCDLPNLTSFFSRNSGG
ncbi:Disease resistance protein [Melia azedarach]|uniref:Disease resistance protein n=1 Tax=Melia azedarach TaxID=155640 RepID=A0ACC1Y3M8_MELAZ|nr:Disease resistance protein [Melia azedarach]